jgi:hypothetical protein
MNGRMKNLVAVVTGGGSGFGESICGSSPIRARVWSSRTWTRRPASVSRARSGPGATKPSSPRWMSAAPADGSRVIAAALARFGRIDAPKSDFGRDGKKLGRC